MCNAEARALSSGLPGEMGRDSDGRDSDAEPRNTRGDPETRFATDTRFFPWMTVESEAPVCRAPLHFLMKVPKLMGPCSVFLPSSPFFFPARPVAATRAEEVCIHSCRQIPAVGNSRKRWTPHLIRAPVTATLCAARPPSAALSAPAAPSTAPARRRGGTSSARSRCWCPFQPSRGLWPLRRCVWTWWRGRRAW